jgi:sodium/potassium/calcium exchanger 6
MTVTLPRKIITTRAAKRKRESDDFITKSALLLTVVTLLLMGCLAIFSPPESSLDASSSTASFRGRRLLDEQRQQDGGGGDDYSQHSCNYIYEMTPDPGADQCRFARTCNGGDGVWAPFVFCSHGGVFGSRGALCALIAPPAALWLVLLFRMLGSTAEDYFSPALEMFAVQLGLPPRFAGVSLLALGNGAADVSATVSAIAGDPQSGYRLALGALTGAAMVISGVISAVVILAADGVACRGALVRDVVALAVTVLAVWRRLGAGRGVLDATETVGLFLALYVVFVLLVLTADVYHRAVVLPRRAAEAAEVERHRQGQEQERQEAALNGIDENGQIPPSPSSSSVEHVPVPSSRGGFAHVMTALSNYDNVPAGAESDQFEGDRPIHLHGRDGILRRSPHTLPVPAEDDAAEEESGYYSRVLGDAVDRACVEPGSAGWSADSWGEALKGGREELMNHASQTWDDIVYDGDVYVVNKFLLLCELPFTMLRKLTVPIPCEGYYCRALVALSLALSPLWFTYYLWDGHGVNLLSAGRWYYVLGWEIFVCLTAMLVLRFAPGGEGSIPLLVSAPIALYGFVMAATWIDTIADSLVSLLNFIGIVLRIPGPVIGLTILAWGNSCSDLSANVTMARKGLANMAMTACFAGPVFNILVGLGLGFSRAAAQTGNTEFEVSLSPSVVTGFVFIVINAVAILTTGLVLGQGRIPTKFGYLALAIYTIYVVTSISLQYSKYGDSSY